MNTSTPQQLLPESLAYQYALRCWKDFQKGAKATRLDKILIDPATLGSERYTNALKLLPPAERRPVAFGELARYTNEFLPQDYDRIRELILPNAAQFELDTLEAVKAGHITLPDRLPVTLEEFPSRIWERAMAAASPKRLVAAGCQAIDSTLRLLSQIDYLPEAENEDCDEIVWHIEIGDIPEVFDLIALAPREQLGLKTRLMDALMAKVEADQSTVFKEVFETIPAWVMLGDQDTDSRIEQLAEDAGSLREELLESGRKNLMARYRLRKLGRLLFRLGHRRESLRAAKSLGLSAWSEGWQFQSIGAAAHAAIRKQLILPGTDVDAWMSKPALACSAMSMPLWLVDGVSRVPELTKIFHQADAFPWIFPRLHHVFQWHLAISGKQEALREVIGMSPDGELGLASG